MVNWFLHSGLVYRDNQLRKEALLIVDGKVVAFGKEAQELRGNFSEEISDFNASNCVISRGFIDLHVHLREPGFENKETIMTGSQAAAAGGFTSIYAMPNTNPTIDNIERLQHFNQLVADSGQVKVKPIGALTKNRAGTELYDYNPLVKAGIKFFSDDGDPIESDLVLTAMENLARLDGVLINHLEDKSLTRAGLFHEALPPESEYKMLERDLEWVAKTNCRYHAAHLSCAESVRLIAQAKKQGLPVTAEVTPHQLVLTHQDIKFPEGHFQMKPPLRTPADRLALIEGVNSGVIDIIATDHAPHGTEKQDGLTKNSPFGVTGLETAFPVLYTKLVLAGEMSLAKLLEALTIAPAKITNESLGLRQGELADLVVVNLEQTRTVDPNKFFSKGTNSPFNGQEFQGWPVLTLVNGYACYQAQ